MKVGIGQGAEGGRQETSFAVRYWPVGIFVAFVVLLLWRPLLGGDAFFWGTPLLQFVPWQRMAAAMWRGGHLPLWNPLVGCGAPLAANYQTAAFYPLNLLYLLLPAEVALSWTTALHLLLAGWGMYRWCRAVALDRFPAFVGALAFSGSGFLVGRVALFPSIAFAFPWLAVWLWRAEVMVQGGRSRDAVWLGLALGLGLLVGHAQTVFYGGMMLAAYLIFRTLAQGRHHSHSRGRERRSFLVRRLLLTLVSLIVGLGLAAAQLLPTAELMLQSQRSTGVDYDLALTYSMWPWRLLTFVVPDFFGHPGRGDYWGYATYWEDAGYVGVLPLLLAAEAVFGSRRRGERGRAGQVWFWVVTGAVGLLLALGINTPVFPFLFRHVPTFNLFQAPARWLALTTVALAVLAAFGAQQWPVGRRGRRRGALGVAVGIAMVAGGLLGPRLVPSISVTFGSATARLGGTCAVAGALTLLRRAAAVRLGAHGESWWRAAVAAFIALDLLLFGWPLILTVDRSLYSGSTETAIVLQYEPDAVRVYWPTDPTQPDSGYSAEYRVKFGYLTFDDFGPRDVGYWWGMREAQLPNVGMLDGVASANNFEPLLVGRYVDLLDAVVEAPGLLRLMGVTHVASDRPWPGGEPIHASGTATLYRLPDSPGRAWVVPAARQVPAGDMLAALTDPAFDPTAEVLLERPLPTVRHPASDIQYQITLQDAPNRVTIRAILSEPGYLVLADTWYPGWRATVDGEATELLRANYAFVALALDAGDHVVEAFYRPLSARLGTLISVGVFVAVAVGWFVSRWGDKSM